MNNNLSGWAGVLEGKVAVVTDAARGIALAIIVK